MSHGDRRAPVSVDQSLKAASFADTTLVSHAAGPIDRWRSRTWSRSPRLRTNAAASSPRQRSSSASRPTASVTVGIDTVAAAYLVVCVMLPVRSPGQRGAPSPDRSTARRGNPSAAAALRASTRPIRNGRARSARKPSARTASRASTAERSTSRSSDQSARSASATATPGMDHMASVRTRSIVGSGGRTSRRSTRVHSRKRRGPSRSRSSGSGGRRTLRQRRWR